MKTILLILLSVVVIKASAQKTQKEYTAITNDLLTETQYTFDKENGGIVLLWYVPTEYWEYSFKSGNDLTPEQIEEYVDILDRHTLCIVVDADITAVGTAIVMPREEIFQNTSIVSSGGEKFQPLAEENIDTDFKMFRTIMEPILANMLGQLGQGMVLLAFDKNDKNGKPLLDPLGNKPVTIKYKEFDYKLDLPLAALLDKKTCPKDKKQMSGKWNYCPIHGEKLK